MDSGFHRAGNFGDEMTSCSSLYTDGKIQAGNTDCKFRRKHATDHQ